VAGEEIENPIEAEYVGRDGEPYWAERIHLPIVWDGEPALLATWTNITEHKRVREELEPLKNRLASENTYLQEEIRLEHDFEEIVTQSVVFKRVLRQIKQIAGTGSSVLITGETGTGKELIARSLHNLSPRRDRPLVKVN
jgi:transcriptional regulator with GAF, ATPase, and Fis domain